MSGKTSSGPLILLNTFPFLNSSIGLIVQVTIQLCNNSCQLICTFMKKAS